MKSYLAAIVLIVITSTAWAQTSAPPATSLSPAPRTATNDVAATNEASSASAPSLTTADAVAVGREASRYLTVSNASLTIPGKGPGGAVVKAVKAKKPWDLINPFAPTRAGDGFSNVVTNEDGRIIGFKLISCGF